MLNFWKTNLEKTAIHRVGNKQLDEGIILSNNLIGIKENQELRKVLVNFFLSQFKDLPLSKFTHPAELALNDVYVIASKIFNSPKDFLTHSKNLAQILYDCMAHPKIKSGELYIAYFSDVVYEDEVCDAIGIFKSEDKQTFLQINRNEQECKVDYREGIETGKLAKGALILNTNKEDGYIICALDNINRTEALYWNEDFLKLKPAKNDYNLTSNLLEVTKKYITHQLKEEFEVVKTNQVDYLNKSIEYFQQNEHFDEKGFTKQVFADPNIAKSFRKFRDDFSYQSGVQLADKFSISGEALKKQGKGFRGIIKLDKNFQIYVQGDTNLIEQGVDEQGRKFYKLYYSEES